MKNIIPEYADCTLEEIEGLINPHGCTEVNPKVYSSEDSGKGNETTTYYDVLVDCALPNKQEVCVDLFFDLEMQREGNIGYPLVKRGIYYCCRLISRQIEVLGKESYNQLRPVYSVWIILNGIPKDLQNSIYTAKMSGSFNNHTDASDLNRQIDILRLNLVYLSEDLEIEGCTNDLVRYLQSVFTRQIDDPCFNPYYNYSREVKKEVDEIMTMKEAFISWGEARGEAKGILGAIKALRDVGVSDSVILLKLQEIYNLTPKQAEQYIEKA